MNKQELMAGDFYQGKDGLLYEVLKVSRNKVWLNRLRDNVTQQHDLSDVDTWMSNGALTIYLSSEQIDF
jgi:hypothetical protein